MTTANEQPDRKKNGAGKGDRYRSVNKKKYDENHIRIFGDKPFNIWDLEEKDPSGSLIKE